MKNLNLVQSLIEAQVERLSNFETGLSHEENFSFWDKVHQSQNEIEVLLFQIRNANFTSQTEAAQGYALDLWHVSKWFEFYASRCKTVTQNEANSLRAQNENLLALTEQF